MNFSSTNLIGSKKIKLREPTTVEDLYNLMTERWQADLPGKFQLKKGLFGSYIKFDTYLTIQPRIKVKNNLVKITRVKIDTRVGGVNIKATTQAFKAMQDGGGIKNVAFGGKDYFLNVCNEMENILKDKME